MKKEGALFSQSVPIVGEYITLGQLLKYTDVIENGGMAKAFLLENDVLVNGELETRRGRKLVPGDCVEVQGKRFEIS